MKQKHCEVIKAWADGKQVQVKDVNGNWVTYGYGQVPLWHEHYEYRIKPEPKPDVVSSLLTLKEFDGQWSVYQHQQQYYLHQIRITFDGETGKLKSAEVISD